MVSKVDMALFLALMAGAIALMAGVGAMICLGGLSTARREQKKLTLNFFHMKREFERDLAALRTQVDTLEERKTVGIKEQEAGVDASASTLGPALQPVVSKSQPQPQQPQPEASPNETTKKNNDAPQVKSAAASKSANIKQASLVPEAMSKPSAASLTSTLQSQSPSKSSSQPSSQSSPPSESKPSSNSSTPRKRRSLEEALGAKVFVWVGGVALALAGAFLVKYSWENQLLSVGMRLLIAALFGGAMVIAGTWLGDRSARVSAALVAAGVADLYGVTFATSSVYHFVGPTFGFVLLGLVTALAVVLSLRHGQFVALLGLVGGFCTPLLVGDERPASGALLGYLLVLQIGLVVVTRQRGWIGLSAATLVGSVMWGLVQAFTGTGPEGRLIAGTLGLVSAAMFVLNAARMQARDAAAGKNRRMISPFGLAVSALAAAGSLLGIVTVRGGYQPQELAMVGLLGAGALALARLDRRYLAIPWLTLGLSAAMTMGSQASASSHSLMLVSLGFSALYGMGGYVACWDRRRVPAVSFASLAGVGGMLMLLLATGWSPEKSFSVTWMFAAVAGVYAAMGFARVRRRPYAQASGLLLLAAFGSGAAAIAAGVGPLWAGTHGNVWGIATLALLAALAAWTSRTTAFRHHGWWAVAGCALPVALRLLNPVELWSHFAVGQAGVSAWHVTALYGVSVAGLVAAVSGLAPRNANHRGMRDALGVAATVLATMGAGFALFAAFSTLNNAMETSWLRWVVALFAAGGAVAAASYAWARHQGLCATQNVSSAAAFLAGVVAIVGLPLTQAPLLGADYRVVGGKVIHELWLAYAVAVAGLWALGWQRFGNPKKTEYTHALQSMAWIVAALGVMAMVRRAFQGSAAWPLTPSAGELSMLEMSAHVSAMATLCLLALSLGRLWPKVDPARMLSAGAPQVAILSAAMGAVGLGLMKNPLWSLQAVGGGWGWGQLLFAYGVPAILLFVTAHQIIQQTSLGHRDTLVVYVRAAAGLLAVLGAMLLIRHVFHQPDLRMPAGFKALGKAVPQSAHIGFGEYGTYAIATLTLALAGVWFRLPWSKAAPAVAMAGTVVAVVGAGAFANPLHFAEQVGDWPVFNTVLWVLGGPALLATLIAWRLDTTHERMASFLSGGAMTLAFGVITLLVRQAFVGPYLTLESQGFAPAEWYAYSLAWLVLGGALLAAGVMTGRPSLRYGSLAVLLLAVGKVFLLDTRHLDGLLRAGSFLGLGLTLMALGLVYQRFVFGTKEPDVD